MTIDQVVRRRDAMSPGERYATWLVCGGEDHPVLDLSRTDLASGGDYYCGKCWTMFSETGKACDPPRPIPSWHVPACQKAGRV